MSEETRRILRSSRLQHGSCDDMTEEINHEKKSSKLNRVHSLFYVAALIVEV